MAPHQESLAHQVGARWKESAPLAAAPGVEGGSMVLPELFESLQGADADFRVFRGDMWVWQNWVPPCWLVDGTRRSWK